MVYLKQNKQIALATLAKVVADGNDLLRRIRGTPGDESFLKAVEQWFDGAVETLEKLVDEGSALMSFRASFFPDRWHVNDQGVSVSGTGLRLCAFRHVHVPLTALVDIVREVEQAPEESDAVTEITAHLDEFRLAVFKQLHDHHESTITKINDVYRLAHWTYTDLEPLFLQLAREELKPAVRRILERYGPRSLSLLGSLGEGQK